MLMRLKPKGAQSVALLLNRGTRTLKTAGVQAGAYSFVGLLEQNMVTRHLASKEAGWAARPAVGVAGRGTLEKAKAVR